MNQSWERQFRHRINRFEAPFTDKSKGLSISIKIRVTSGCYHREHSPKAYKIIDEYLYSHRLDKTFSFQEHESGPELLVYLALGTAGITLAKSVINLVITIIKARSEGIRQGDSPNYPLEIIVRNFDKKGMVREEKVMRINSHDPINCQLVEDSLNEAVTKLLDVPEIDNKKVNNINRSDKK